VLYSEPFNNVASLSANICSSACNHGGMFLSCLVLSRLSLLFAAFINFKDGGNLMQ